MYALSNPLPFASHPPPTHIEHHVGVRPLRDEELHHREMTVVRSDEQWRPSILRCASPHQHPDPPPHPGPGHVRLFAFTALRSSRGLYTLIGEAVKTFHNDIPLTTSRMTGHTNEVGTTTTVQRRTPPHPSAQPRSRGAEFQASLPQPHSTHYERFAPKSSTLSHRIASSEGSPSDRERHCDQKSRPNMLTQVLAA